MTTSYDAVDIPLAANAPATYDSPWAREVQQQNSPVKKTDAAATTPTEVTGAPSTTPAPEAAPEATKSASATGDKGHAPAEKKAELSPQDAAFVAWYEGTTTGKVPFQQSYDRATAYCQTYGDSSKYHNEQELAAMSQWIQKQKERPCVEINVLDWTQQHHTPSDEEIGVRIAKQLGFTDGEMCVYASEHGYKTPGAAFYKSPDGHSGKTLLAQAQHDPAYEGRVNIGEVNPGAISSTKKWLKEERESNLPPNPINNYDYAKERTAFEAIFANIYNPVASAGDGLANTLGDIVQGVGLPAHVLTDRTFMDNFADWMRKKGDAMPMYDLYTDKEKDDAVVCLANLYGQAGGSAAPYLLSGGLAGGAAAGAEATEAAAVSARAYVAAARFAGTAQMAGNVYNSALDFQAQQIARKEAGDHQLSAEELQKRVDEIKQGKNIDAQKRDEIDRRALVAAVIAAPAGVIPAEYLEQLGALRSAGTPIAKMPAELMEKLSASAIKGGVIGTGMVVASETAQVAAGVKRPDEAAQSVSDNAPKVALAGAMLGVTGEAAAMKGGAVKVEETTVHPEIGHAGGDASMTMAPYPMAAQGSVQGRPIRAGESFIVGRTDAHSGQVLIDKNTVSAEHCSVRLDAAGNYIIKDLFSRNGTYINGHKIPANQEFLIRPTDKVTLGTDTPLKLASIDTVVEFGGMRQQLKMGQELPIGRNTFGNVDGRVSGDHLRLGLDQNGVYIVESGSRNGTYITRNGERQRVVPNQKTYVLPTDKIELGSSIPGSGETLTFSRTSPSDVSDIQARLENIPRPENARGRMTPGALRQSNEYGRNHEIIERLQDGWQNAGRDTVFSPDGHSTSDSYRPSVVVDRQNDPVLQAVIQEVHEKYGNLPPRERAEAMTRLCKKIFTPEGWNSGKLDAWYDSWSDQHAGERVMLGDMIKGGKGVCSQQAILLKVLADSFPDMQAKLVRGNAGGSGPDTSSMNHAWTEFDFGDGKPPTIYDPRQQFFGDSYDRVGHTPGRVIIAKKP